VDKQTVKQTDKRRRKTTPAVAEGVGRKPITETKDVVLNVAGMWSSL